MKAHVCDCQLPDHAAHEKAHHVTGWVMFVIGGFAGIVALAFFS